jgi:anti-sigma regulatory factor (Ser/Thr protein kinase)
MTTTTLRHNMYVYDDDGCLAERVVPFLHDGLTSDEAVVAVVDRHAHDVLRETLGTDAEHVVFLDRYAFYSRPETAIASLDMSLRKLRQSGADALRAYGEPPPRDAPAERRAWAGYEAIVNAALAHHPLWVMCGYDARRTCDEILDAAWSTHAGVLTDDWQTNERYENPTDFLRALATSPIALPGLRTVPVGDGARAFRRALLAEMAADRVPEAEAQQLLIAASEVYTNAGRHGGGGVAQVRVGRDGDRFVCEITDTGAGFDDPLAGYIPPSADSTAGAGLWAARQNTRRLEMQPAATGGMSVQLWI